MAKMKHNLKNRPYFCGYGEEYAKQEKCIREVFEWFEGFEKELREMYAHQKIIYKIPTVSIREVLGE